MASNDTDKKIPRTVSAQPRLHQRGAEIQAYGTVNHLLPLELEEPVRLEMTALLNQLLADTMTLRDLYKKAHWQVVGPTFCADERAKKTGYFQFFGSGPGLRFIRRASG